MGGSEDRIWKPYKTPTGPWQKFTHGDGGHTPSDYAPASKHRAHTDYRAIGAAIILSGSSSGWILRRISGHIRFRPGFKTLNPLYIRMLFELMKMSARANQWTNELWSVLMLRLKTRLRWRQLRRRWMRLMMRCTRVRESTTCDENTAPSALALRKSSTNTKWSWTFVATVCACTLDVVPLVLHTLMWSEALVC